MARIRGLHPSLNPSTNPSTPTTSGGNPPYRKKGATAVVLPRFWQGLLLAMLLVVPCVLVEAQGNIFITGHDVDGHGGQHLYDVKVFDFLRTDGYTSTNFPGPANYKISLIGAAPESNANLPPSGWTANSPNYYPDMTYYSTLNLNTGTAGANNYNWAQMLAVTDCLVVLSHTSAYGELMTCPGTIPQNFPTGAEPNSVQSLYNQKTFIENAFNNGMDLFVLSGAMCNSNSHSSSHSSSQNGGQTAPYYYDFLPTNFLSPAGTLSATHNFFITPFGCATVGLRGENNYTIPGCVPDHPCDGYSDNYADSMVDHQTHNHFGRMGNCGPNGSPSFSPLLTPVESYDLDTGNGCPNGDDCEVVVSLAAVGITLGPPTPPYCTYQNLEVYCDPSGLNYIWTFELGVVGADGASIEVVPWTDFGAFPGTFVPPMPWSLPIPDGSTVQFTGGISGIPAGYGSFMADIIIRDAQGMIICAPETQVNLPNCCVSSPGPGPGEIPMNIECLTEEEGDGFSFSAEIVNHSGFDIVKIFIPDVVDPTSGVTLVDIEPNVIVPATPIATGDLLPDLDLNFGGVASGDDFTLTVVLMAKDDEGEEFECCSRDLDVALPVCCNELVEHEVHCQDSDGNFPFDFSFLNWDHIGPIQASHAFLLPIYPTPAGVSFDPDYIDLTELGTVSPVADLMTSNPLSTFIVGASLNQEITFELIIHNEDMSECCNQVHTIVMSDCVADDGGGSGVDTSSEFLRGDANADGSFDIADVIWSLGYLFQDLPVSCLLARSISAIPSTASTHSLAAGHRLALPINNVVTIPVPELSIAIVSPCAIPPTTTHREDKTMKHPYTQTTDSRAPQWILRAATAPARPLAWLAVLLAVLIALPTVELAAQECIDFEMNPAAGGLWAEGDMVTDQYRISHGISFSVVVDGAHFPDHGPVIAMVGGDDACAFGNGNNPLDYCEDPIDGGQNTVFDNPSYSSVSPFDGTHPPDNPLDDIRCFFLTDHACINGDGESKGPDPDPPGSDYASFALRVTYDPDFGDCFQLSGRILDTDTWTGPLPERWTVVAYGTDASGNTGVSLGSQVIDPLDPNVSLDNDGAIQSFTIDVSAGGIPIDYVDIEYTGDVSLSVNNVGLGFDNFCPCSIDEGGCGEVIEPEIECDLDTPGNYNYSFLIGNDSGFDVVKVLIPDVDLGDGTVIDVEPNIIEMFIYDQDASGLIDHLTFSGGAPGTSFNLAIGLMAKNDDGEYFECCALVETIELPHCCNSLLNFSVADTDPPPHPGSGEYNQIQFDITNEEYLKPTVASHLFLVPITPGLTFDPDYFYLPSGIADNTSTNGPLVTNLGQTYGVSTSITFEVVIHNDDFSECCNEIHTVAGIASPLPVQAPFVRGDGNADGLFDIGDAVYPVPCEAAADTNGDALIDLADPIYTLEALFAGGSDPPYPYPGCGLESETNPDHLECQSYGVCP